MKHKIIIKIHTIVTISDTSGEIYIERKGTSSKEMFIDVENHNNLEEHNE